MTSTAGHPGIFVVSKLLEMRTCNERDVVDDLQLQRWKSVHTYTERLTPFVLFIVEWIWILTAFALVGQGQLHTCEHPLLRSAALAFFVEVCSGQSFLGYCLDVIRFFGFWLLFLGMLDGFQSPVQTSGER